MGGWFLSAFPAPPAPHPTSQTPDAANNSNWFLGIWGPNHLILPAALQSRFVFLLKHREVRPCLTSHSWTISSKKHFRENPGRCPQGLPFPLWEYSSIPFCPSMCAAVHVHYHCLSKFVDFLLCVRHCVKKPGSKKKAGIQP